MKFTASDIVRREIERMRELDRQLEIYRRAELGAEALRQLERNARVIAMGGEYRRLLGAVSGPLEKFFGHTMAGSEAIKRMLEDAEAKNRWLEMAIRPSWAVMSSGLTDAVRAIDRLKADEIGKAIRLSDAARGAITANFYSASDALLRYSADLGGAFEESQTVSRSLWKLPLSGYTEDIHFLRSISTDRAHEQKPVVEKKGKVRSTLVTRQEKKIKPILQIIDADLIVFWDDAEAIACSESRSKGKSACAGLRTIMRNVLDHLAPPAKAQKDCAHFEDLQEFKGKGFRLKAQVRYICGGTVSPFSLAIEEQVSFLMTCLNAGDHGIGSALAITEEDIYGLMILTSTCVTMLYKIHCSKTVA